MLNGIKGVHFPEKSRFSLCLFPLWGVIRCVCVHPFVHPTVLPTAFFTLFLYPSAPPVLPLSGTIFPASGKWYLTPLLTVCKGCPLPLWCQAVVLPGLPPLRTQICHRSPPFLAVSHARALLYYARACTKTVRTPAKPLCKRVLSHSRTSAHRIK